DRVRDRLAQDVEPPFELGFALDLLAAADEYLQMHGLGRLHRFAERRVVGRHLAPAQERHALALDHLGIDVADHLPPVRIARHEQRADRVFARLGQDKAETVRLLGEELVRDLHQNAGAVAGARIGADRPAMFEVAEDGERVLDQLVRSPALDVGNKAHTAGILVERGIIKALRRRQSRIRAVAQAERSRARAHPLTSSLCAMSCRAHPCPRLSPAQTLRERLLLGASLASAAPIGVTAPRTPLVIGGLLATALRLTRVWPLVLGSPGVPEGSVYPRRMRAGGQPGGGAWGEPPIGTA